MIRTSESGTLKIVNVYKNCEILNGARSQLYLGFRNSSARLLSFTSELAEALFLLTPIQMNELR
jgi:hypothetical protein